MWMVCRRVTVAVAAMLEVYLLRRSNVVNLRMLASCCAWNYTPVKLTQTANCVRIFIFPHFISVFVHVKYTSNMAARYSVT